jgi:hypothetical protein
VSNPVDKTTTYEIKVRGHIDSGWADWFDGMIIQTTFNRDGAPVTILTGPVADQCALSGMLVQISDMNLTLISVNPVSSDGSN